jgi:hypothetical protein
MKTAKRVLGTTEESTEIQSKNSANVVPFVCYFRICARCANFSPTAAIRKGGISAPSAPSAQRPPNPWASRKFELLTWRSLRALREIILISVAALPRRVFCG